jgi:plasmid segregation protein ParM
MFVQEVSNFLSQLHEKGILLVGADSGNTSGKFSFLDEYGNVCSFVIPTVIAPAPSSKRNLKESSKKDISVENLLHLRIKSHSLSAEMSNSYWYVGSYAENKKERIEPKIIVNSSTQEKSSQKKYQNNLHVIMTLAGLAVAAIRSNRTEVSIPYSGGLPINEFKEIGEEKALEAIKGDHEVEFIDGPFEKKIVKIHIHDGSIHVEGVTCSLALAFDIKKGELIETKLGEELGENFALGDLGAGTTDNVLFTENGIDKELSGNINSIGTNQFIDELMHEVYTMSEFAQIREIVNEKEVPYKTREHFMKGVVESEIFKMVDDPDYQPVFKVKWMFVENIDVTEKVLLKLEDYGKKQVQELLTFWAKAMNTNKFVLVGGGLLFGYTVFKNMKDKFIFPPNIKDAQFFTSRSYLIANYLDHYEKYMA